MKKSLSTFGLLAAGSFLISITAGFAQGTLTPPGAPAQTMRTLTQIEPRTPISGPLPITISSPGSYYLTTNLTGLSGFSGITISANEVTLDLNGFTLFGVPGAGGGVVIGNNYTNITIRDGSLTGWPSEGVNGYTYGYPRNVIYEHLTISGNGSGGIAAEATSIIRDCLILNNAGDGIYSVGSLITGCVVRDNSNNGMNISGSTVHSCVVHFNHQYGITADHSTVADCDILNNTNGLVIANACHISNNRIADHGSLTAGIGLTINGSANVVVNNSIVNNNQGLYALGTNNCVIQNRFIANVTGYNFTTVNVLPVASIQSSAAAANFTNGNALVNIFY